MFLSLCFLAVNNVCWILPKYHLEDLNLSLEDLSLIFIFLLLFFFSLSYSGFGYLIGPIFQKTLINGQNFLLLSYVLHHLTSFFLILLHNFFLVKCLAD